MGKFSWLILALLILNGCSDSFLKGKAKQSYQHNEKRKTAIPVSKFTTEDFCGNDLVRCRNEEVQIVNDLIGILDSDTQNGFFPSDYFFDPTVARANLPTSLQPQLNVSVLSLAEQKDPKKRPVHRKSTAGD